MKNKKEKPKQHFMGSRLMIRQDGTVYDPLGSYTGVGEDPLDTPVQDADDL